MSAKAVTVARWLPEERLMGRERHRFARRGSARKCVQVAVALSSTNSHLAYCARGRLRIVELNKTERGKEVLDYRLGDGLSWLVEKIIFTGKDSSLLLVHADGSTNCISNLPMFSTERNKPITESLLFNRPSLDVDACKLHSLAVVGSEDGMLLIFDPCRFNETREELFITRSIIGSVSLSENGRFATVCSNFQGAVLVQIGTLEGKPSSMLRQICVFEGLRLWTWGCVLTSDATRAVTGTNKLSANMSCQKETTIRVWDLEPSKAISTPHMSEITVPSGFYSVSGDASIGISLDDTHTMLYFLDLFHPSRALPHMVCTFNTEVSTVCLGKGGMVACATVGGDVIVVDLFDVQRRGLLCLVRLLPTDVLQVVKDMLLTQC